MNIKEIARAQMRISCDELGIGYLDIELDDHAGWGGTYERGRYDAEMIYGVDGNFKGFMNDKIILRPSRLDTWIQVRGTVAHECRHAWQLRQPDYPIDFGEEEEDDARQWAREQVDENYRDAFSDVKIDQDNDVLVKMGDIWGKHEGATKQLKELLG